MEAVFAYSDDLFSLEISGRIKGYCGEYLKRIGATSFDDDAALVDYGFSTKPDKLGIWDEDEGKCVDVKEAGTHVRLRPVFFETRYFFRADFKDVADVRVVHPLASVCDSFDFSRGTLVGTLDFINTPGKFRLQLDVRLKDGTRRTETLDFMIVSVKMDVVRDYNRIIEDIQKEQRDLVFRFMSKTSLGARLIDTAEPAGNDVWYGIFQKVCDYYLKACKMIVGRPHVKYTDRVYGARADRIKRWNVQLVNRYASMNVDRRETEIFRVTETEPTTDTQENRFVLKTLHEISERLDAFAKELGEAKPKVSDEYLNRIREQCDALKQMKSHRFFKRVGRFTGFRQESLVLQKKAGYAQVYAAWLTLKKGLEPVGGDVDVGHRPISALYEFWCFLAMRKILEAKFGKPAEGTMPDWTKLLDHGDDDEGGLFKLDVVFTDAKNNRTITLSYQKSYGENDDDDGTFASLNSQRPDIVLSIKEDEASPSVFTYLFDAKYRIAAKNGKDMSPREAIDDMHRYRDAILYRAQKDAVRAHEVIGAYVLFPGRQLPHSYDYAQVIHDENIGAIPLLPGDDGEKALCNFIHEILDKKTIAKHLERAIAPRGAAISLEPDCNVLVVRQKWNDRTIDSRKGGAIYIDKELDGDGVLPLPLDYVFVIEDGMGIELHRVEKTTIESRKKIRYHLVLQHKYEDQNSIDENVLHHGQLTSRNHVDELMR